MIGSVDRPQHFDLALGASLVANGNVSLRSEPAVVRAAEAIGETGIRGWAPQPAPPPESLILAQAAGTAGPLPVDTAPAPDDLTLARLCQSTNSPDVVLPAGWQPASEAEMLRIGIDTTQFSVVGPGRLGSPNSTFVAAVYTEGTGDHQRFVVAFRGSTMSLSDWMTNGAQPFNIPTDHYNRALLIGGGIGDSGAPNVTITGHSLGGGLASTAAIASGRNAATFNAAGLSEGTLNTARAEASRNGFTGMPDIRAYYVRGEILSFLQDGGDRVLGGALGALITRSARGAAAGASHADAPEAVGTRIPIDWVRPPNTGWFGNTPIHAHLMPHVISGMEAHLR